MMVSLDSLPGTDLKATKKVLKIKEPKNSMDRGRKQSRNIKKCLSNIFSKSLLNRIATRT